MRTLCWYFQVHQPFRLRHYSLFDIGNSQDYFDEHKNREVMKKVAQKCYLPMNALLLKLIQRHGDAFNVSFSISGTALDQFEQYAPEVLESFKQLVATGNVELLSETYYHSLSFLYDKKEFDEQVIKHRTRIKELFDYEPTVFRNTELIYSNEVAQHAAAMGYKAILAEGADHALNGKSPNYVYTPQGADIKLLLKNYQFSDDIAFRFSNKGWKEHPLTVEKFAGWLDAVMGDSVNLFMDYETFGEHQWEDTGIFKFMEALPSTLLPLGTRFITPNELATTPPRETLDIPFTMSWADVERDLSAWLGNKMQLDAIERLYALKAGVFKTGNPALIETWRKLTTSDHFYYMCVKWFSDGDVHKYFNPYDSPYDGFIIFMNVLNDLALRVENAQEKTWLTIGGD
ncbi:alpha-amylase [Candidatus Woesearchaeota archaeon]|nr:alpha-amylase [Candidatus Woesearchaeota archaeon]